MRRARLLTAVLVLACPALVEGAGWYLLAPPSDDSTAPRFERWQHLGSYDSARACEGGKQKLGEHVAMLIKQTGKPSPENREAWRQIDRLGVAVVRAECVSVKDPRLRYNPRLR